MRKVGAFICNYNKAEFVIRCVAAIKNQTFKDIDIFVVDNASEDNSVALLREEFGDSITILQNESNLGGSGGFGRAIRTALELDYKYFMLIDNDAFLDEHAAEHLYHYLEEHPEVGICGSETLFLQQPEKIQDLGGKIDWKNYQWGGVIGGLIELPGNVILECDYVASNSLMARTSAVREFGGFSEENFIYWDDIEWCTKCWKAGYKVVVNGNAKALHDMAGANKQNMFLRYYANRNRYRFFTKYLPEEELDTFYNYITEEFFLPSYGAMKKGMMGTVMTAWNAFDDFMHGITGKAKEGKIVPYADPKHEILNKLVGINSVLIYMPRHEDVDYRALNSLMRLILNNYPDMYLEVSFDLSKEKEFDLCIEICEHVNQIKENILPRIYVDRLCNAVLNENDYWYFKNYNIALSKFREMYRPLFEERKRELR